MAKKKVIKGISMYRDFIVLYDCASREEQARVFNLLLEAPCPSHIDGVELPQNLQTATFGQIDDLSRNAKGEDLNAKCLKVIGGLSDEQIYNANVFDVFGFACMCNRELTKINNLFSKLKVSYSNEEVSAGVYDLSFGTFGVADWYARRMGIVNQNDVYDIAWVRIYQCLKMDTEQNNYERRLQRQYQTRK